MTRLNTQGAASAAPRLSLGIEEAAASLGISRDAFDKHVLPKVRIAKIGTRTVVAVRELEKYLDRRGV